MFEAFGFAQINSNLVRAAYAIGGSLRAAGRLLNISPSTVSGHLRAPAGLEDPFGGPRLVRPLGFSAANQARIEQALLDLPDDALDRLTAAQAVVTRGTEASSEGYARYLARNPTILNERIEQAIEYAELSGATLEDLAVEGIAS